MKAQIQKFLSGKKAVDGEVVELRAWDSSTDSFSGTPTLYLLTRKPHPDAPAADNGGDNGGDSKGGDSK